MTADEGSGRSDVELRAAERLLAAARIIAEAEQRLDSRRRPKSAGADRQVPRDR